MSLDPLDYLGALKRSLLDAQAPPNVIETVDKANDTYSRKWWHEVSGHLLDAMESPLVRAVAYDIYKHVVMPIRLELSTVNYIKLLFLTVQSISGTEEGTGQVIELLDSATNGLVSNGNSQAQRCVQCVRALFLMSDGPSLEGKRLLDETTEFLATLQPHEIEPILQALLTKARCRLHELAGDFTAFYETVFLMLAYAEKCNMIGPDEYGAIAYKTALAALLSKTVHSFGQLLTYAPLVTTLEKGADAWLLELVRIFNAGDVGKFEAFLNTHNGLQSTPELHAAIAHLRAKVRSMGLLHLIFNTRADSRVFTFAQLAERCCVSEREAELIVLSAMANHLIEGSIDGLRNTVEITWLQPRVVDKTDIRALALRVRDWRKITSETAIKVAELAKEVPN